MLLDLSAAFDTIDHQIILERLETLTGVHRKVIAWFRFYLSENISVCLCGWFVLSDKSIVSFAIPQGSVLGPLLFSLNILPLGAIIVIVK